MGGCAESAFIFIIIYTHNKWNKSLHVSECINFYVLPFYFLMANGYNTSKTSNVAKRNRYLKCSLINQNINFS